MPAPSEHLPRRFQIKTTPPADARKLSWLLGKKRLPTPAQYEAYRHLLMQGDPLADELAAWVAEAGFAHGRRLLDQALEHGIDTVPDAPLELRRFFTHVEAQPLWLDWELLELGQRTIRRGGPIGSLIMRDVALMGGYGNAAINKPLVFTGALADGAYRRTSETRAFAVDAARPGALAHGHSGFKTTVRVRFLHGLLRQRIRSHADWRDDEWGVPINQGDMLATNLAFSMVYLIGMRSLGFRYSRREREGVLHLWRYIGYLMGIDERILVSSETEGLRVLYTVLMTQPAPDDDTRALAHALMNEPYEARPDGSRIARWRAETHVRMHNGVSHLFLGSEAYRQLGLPDDRRWTWFPLLLIPVISGAETVRQVLPFGSRLFAKVGGAWIDRWLAKLLQNKPAEYKPVATLARDREA